MRQGFIIFIIIANLLFAFANIPWVYRIVKTPPDKIFPGNHLDIQSDNRVDYHEYLSAINQGKNGFWLYYDPYTTEKTKPGYFFSFYIILGKIAKILNLWPPVAYHLARFASIEFFFVALFWLLFYLFKKKSIFALLFSLLATIAPRQLFVFEPYAYSAYIPWWNAFHSIFRLDLPPHYIIGQALFLVAIYQILKYLHTKDKKTRLIILASTLLAGLILTPTALVLLIAIPISYLIVYGRNKIFGQKISFEKEKIIFLFIVMLVSSITILLALFQTKSGFPWSMWSEWEKSMWNNPNFIKSSFLVLGILPILSLPALIKILHFGSISELIISFWAFFPFILLPFANFLGIGGTRLFFVAPFIPFAILATKSLFEVTPPFSKTIYQTIFMLIFLIAAIPALFFSFKGRLSDMSYVNPQSYIYIPKSTFTTFNFINKQISPGKAILTGPTIGNLLPAYTTAKTYIGHPVLSYDYGEKIKIVFRFYSGQMSEDEAKKFLNNNNITYIYAGKEEKSYGFDIKRYPFLKTIFSTENEEVLKQLER